MSSKRLAIKPLRSIWAESNASNLAQDDDNNGPDVFLYNRDVSGSGVFDQPGNTHLSCISVSPGDLFSGGGYKGLDISADGRYIAFSVSGWYGHDCAYYTNYYRADHTGFSCL